jgi:glutamine amidotransferase
MICIIDYEIGNVISIKNAFERLGQKVIITHEKEEIKGSSHIILPGVGAFLTGIKNLKKYDLINILNNEVINNNKKILGICLGFQLMCKTSSEFGLNSGLGWLDINIEKIDDEKNLIPHVGWNKVKIVKQECFFDELANDKFMYFNHSFAAKYKFENNQYSDLMTCEYGDTFIAGLRYKNIYAIQPHPEKSQKFGLEILKKFIQK